MRKVHLIHHPLILQKLTYCRQKRTVPKEFRALVEELTYYMLYEVTKDYQLVETEIETPIGKAKGYLISGDKPVFVAILRAGLGMLSSALRMIPMAGFGHIGVYRDKDTLEPVQYYCKLPNNLQTRQVILLDPILATGGTAVAALRLLQEKEPLDIKFVTLVAAHEGITAIHQEFPQVDIYVAAIDSGLNADGYIVPGLGDVGDRLFDT